MGGKTSTTPAHGDLSTYFPDVLIDEGLLHDATGLELVDVSIEAEVPTPVGSSSRHPLRLLTRT
jgi:hypothetical protein